MRNIRVIPRLDIKGPNLVKGIHLEGLRVLGLPERFSSYYFQDEADELIYIDSVASLYGRNNLKEIVEETAQNVFIPMTVGGGIRTIHDIRSLLRAGADKIAINTGAVRNPKLIAEAAKMFGSQCIVLSIQAMKLGNGKYEAYTDNAREPTGKDVFEWAREAVDLGAGEILITSIDRDGTGYGYDIDLVSGIVGAVNVPVIACGGAGSALHVKELLDSCDVGAVCAASLFHYQAIRKFGVEKRREGNVEYLKEFADSENPVMSRIEPISVSSLKAYLADSKQGAVEIRRAHDFKTKNGEMQREFTLKRAAAGPVIVLLDYGRNNLFSVRQAFENIHAKVKVTGDPDRVRKADKLVIAGVGAFGDGMAGMGAHGLLDAVKEFSKMGKSILGICLGMQLFMSEGEEFGFHEGLDVIKGKVKKLRDHGADGVEIRVPHTGWNRLGYPLGDPNGNRWASSPLMEGITSEEHAYFVHSYMVIPEESDTVVAETEYGSNRICSVIESENIMGCQFHPERSGILGLRIYRNFLLS